jgi:hypothetical protein
MTASATPSTRRAVRIAGKVSCTSGDAHDRRVEPAAEIAGDEPERHPDRQRNDDREHPDADRDPHAIEDRREDVAALIVGPERELGVAVRPPRRRQVGIHDADGAQVERAVRRDERGEQRRQHQHDGDERRHDGELLRQEARQKIAVPGPCKLAAPALPPFDRAGSCHDQALPATTRIRGSTAA